MSNLFIADDCCQHISQQLFDQDHFLSKLNSTTSPITVFTETLTQGTKLLNDTFLSGGNIVELLTTRAWFTDQLLVHAWQLMTNCETTSLVAVGGYGRRELHPASDIDLMILSKSNINHKTTQDIQQFIAFLWDIGLEVGHSVRTIKDCISEARTDITVTTNLMESRLLIGHEKLFEDMCRATSAKKIWPAKKFFQAKWQEQLARHKKYAYSEYNLEPNIKEGPGGLRDIQMISWVTNRHFGVNSLHELVKHHFLTENEYQTLHDGQIYLWRIRYALHILANRRDDRFLFDYQRQVAKIFGFHSTDNSAVEALMKTYYRTVRELSYLNKLLLQHFQEVIIYKKRRQKIIPVNKRFQIRDKLIEVCHDQVFIQYPFALLEIFLIQQQTTAANGIRASTIRLIRQHTHLINNDFRNDLRNKSLFMEIIRQPKQVGHSLRYMHRYGVLRQYLPVFGAIEGQMQFDLFHVYCVDEHTLFVIQNMRFFGLPQYAETYPLCQIILQKLPKQELLYLAGLFHDIAKGRNGDHSKLGMQDATDFCQQHQLSRYDTNIVAWLVENHLLLSKTAQREDINDPQVINNFAVKVGDIEHLNYLYLLTVADVISTNPTLWNSWKDALFQQLYNETARALRRGLENPINKTERIKETKHLSLALLDQKTQDNLNIEQFWNALGDDYFIRYSPDEIAWHAKSIADYDKQQYPLITIRQETARGGAEIFIYMKNKDNIFAMTTQIVEQLGLTIVDARIVISTHGFTLDTYIVIGKPGNKIIQEQEHTKNIIHKLQRSLFNTDHFHPKMRHRQSRKQKNFSIPTNIQLTQDKVNQRTVIEINATDRAGFLSSIGMVLAQQKIRVHNAKIATYGSRVEDIFFITDRNNRAITSAKATDLKNAIIGILA